MKLLYRGEKFVDESFPDYVHRLAYKNGFITSRKFVRYLLNVYNDLYGETTRDDLVKYRYFDEELKRENWRWYQCRLALEYLLKRNIHKSQLNLFDRNSPECRAVRICQKCWVESKYIRFYWRIERYTSCHKHKEKLIDSTDFKCADHFFVDVFSKYIETTGVATDQVLSKSVEVYGNKNHALENVETELDRNRYEKMIISWLYRFFELNMSVNLNESSAMSLSDSGSLVGLTIYERMERIFEILLVGNKQYESSVRIITVLRIKDNKTVLNSRRCFDRPAPGFDYWASCEGYSIDELFYAYLGFGQLGGTPLNYKFRKEVKGFDMLTDYVDRQLCLVIYRSSLLNPYRLY